MSPVQAWENPVAGCSPRIWKAVLKPLKKCVIFPFMDIKEKIDALVEQLINYQKAYYVDGKPLVSDMEYDRLFDELAELEKENPFLVRPDSPTVRVGSDLSNDFPEVEHTTRLIPRTRCFLLSTNASERNRLPSLLWPRRR